MPVPIPTVYRITLANQPGIVIMCKSAPLGKLIAMANMGIDRNDKDASLKAFAYFARRIIDWNVQHPEVEEDDDGNLSDTCPECGLRMGDALPRTAQSLACLGVDMVNATIASWIIAVSRVSLPKEESYSPGEIDTEMLTSELGSLQSPTTSPLLS